VLDYLSGIILNFAYLLLVLLRVVFVKTRSLEICHTTNQTHNTLLLLLLLLLLFLLLCLLLLILLLRLLLLFHSSSGARGGAVG
jgi:hypothetical protein